MNEVRKQRSQSCLDNIRTKTTSAVWKSKVLSSLEQAFKPIYKTFKDYSSEAELILPNSKDTSELGLAERNSYFYHSEEGRSQTLVLLEYQLYELMRFSSELMLTKKTDFEVSQTPNKESKRKAQLQIIRVKEHFASKFSQLSSIFQSGEESEEEGFFDELSNMDNSKKNYSIAPLKISMSSFKERAKPSISNEGINDQAREISEQRVLVKQLKEKLLQQEIQINGLSSGYIKDMTHMREMMFRKQNKSEAELFEVQYFDSTLGFDETTVNLMNDRLKVMKVQCETVVKEYSRKIVSLTFELKKSKLKLEQLLPEVPSLKDLLQHVFQMEENPYVLWKQIQDVKGNKFFFDVFEVQRPEYGINYKEVNAMLMCKKIYEKEYSLYKQQSDDSLVNLVQKFNQQLRSMTSEINEKNEVISQLRQVKISDQRRIDEAIEQVEAFMTQRQIQISDSISEQQLEVQENGQRFNRLQMRIMFQRWACVNWVLRVCNEKHFEALKNETRMMLRNPPMDRDNVEYLMTILSETQSERDNLLISLDEVKAMNVVLTLEIQQVNAQRRREQEELQQSQLNVEQAKEEALRISMKADNYKTQIEIIFKLLGNKLDDSQFSFLDLSDEQKTSTKALKLRLKSIPENVSRRIREAVIVLEKSAIIEIEGFSKCRQSTATMTELLDVNSEIVYTNQIQLQLAEQRSLLLREFQNQLDNIQRLSSFRRNGSSEAVASSRQKLNKIASLSIQNYGINNTNGDDNSYLDNKTRDNFRAVVRIDFEKQFNPTETEELERNQQIEREAQSALIQEIQQENQRLVIQVEQLRREIEVLTDKLSQANQIIPERSLTHIESTNDNQIRLIQMEKLPQRGLISSIRQVAPGKSNSKQDRLFHQSKEKALRLESLRKEIGLIESLQQEEILSVVNLCDVSNQNSSRASEQLKNPRKEMQQIYHHSSIPSIVMSEEASQENGNFTPRHLIFKSSILVSKESERSSLNFSKNQENQGKSTQYSQLVPLLALKTFPKRINSDIRSVSENRNQSVELKDKKRDKLTLIALSNTEELKTLIHKEQQIIPQESLPSSKRDSSRRIQSIRKRRNSLDVQRDVIKQIKKTDISFLQNERNNQQPIISPGRGESNQDTKNLEKPHLPLSKYHTSILPPNQLSNTIPTPLNSIFLPDLIREMIQKQTSNDKGKRGFRHK